MTHAEPDEYRVAAARCVIQKDCAYSCRRGDQRSSVAPLVKLIAVTARTHQPVATSYKALALLTRNKGTGSDMPSARIVGAQYKRTLLVAPLTAFSDSATTEAQYSAWNNGHISRERSVRNVRKGYLLMKLSGAQSLRFCPVDARGR